jgi:hypothetical protein
MAALDLLTKDNFVQFTGPKFKVFHYWYNILVDRVNAISSDDGALTADTIAESTAATGVTIDSVLLKDGTVDLNGVADALILDADGDTTISAPTANQIDIEVAGADDFRITANTFTALSGSTIATNTIAETTAATGVTIDGVLAKDGGIETASVKHVTVFGVAAPNVTTVEYGDGRHITTTLSFTNLVLGAPTAGGNSAHGVLLHTLSTTSISHLVKCVACEVGFTVGTVTTDTPDVGLGTVIGSGAVATLDGTGTFEDIITGQTWNKALDGTADRFASLFSGVATEATAFPFIDAAGSATAIYLNAADGWAAGVTGNLTATGTIVIEYIIMTP